MSQIYFIVKLTKIDHGSASPEKNIDPHIKRELYLYLKYNSSFFPLRTYFYLYISWCIHNTVFFIYSLHVFNNSSN